MNHARTRFGRILLYQPESAGPRELTEALERLGDVSVESDMDSALAALQQHQFDVFVSASSEFLTPDQFAVNRRLHAVLDVIEQGVCIIDRQGRIVWSNARLQEFPEELFERVRNHCADVYRRTGGMPISSRPRLLSLALDDDRYFDVTILPMVDQDRESVRLVAVVSDVTRARRLQQKMDAIDNAGRELVRVDAEQLAKMDFCQRLELLESKIIRYTRELLDFDNFAIRLLDKKTNKLDLAVCAGLPPEAQHLDIYASTENNGISGYVAATGRSYICPDVIRDGRYLMGIDNARSSLTVPLWLHDHVIGILNIESDRVAAFSEEDRQFAEIFGRYVAIALHILNVLVFERHATTGQLADNVSAEIAGPLSDILSDATTLMEDYIGHDDLRHRLQTIAENVVKIRESIRHVAHPLDGIIGARPEEPCTDPLLADKVVLVIDDEEIIRLTVHDVLAKWGARVETARNGEEALAMIHCRTYDLVISDIKMPGKSGYEIFAEVKARRPGCPVIFMTGFGYDPNHSIIRASQEGLSCVLYKPFKVDELLENVRAAVASASGTDD